MRSSKNIKKRLLRTRARASFASAQRDVRHHFSRQSARARAPLRAVGGVQRGHVQCISHRCTRTTPPAKPYACQPAQLFVIIHPPPFRVRAPLILFATLAPSSAPPSAANGRLLERLLTTRADLCLSPKLRKTLPGYVPLLCGVRVARGRPEGRCFSRAVANGPTPRSARVPHRACRLTRHKARAQRGCQDLTLRCVSCRCRKRAPTARACVLPDDSRARRQRLTVSRRLSARRPPRAV